MNSLCIFICQDCRLATKRADDRFWTYERKYEGLANFILSHKGHRIEVHSDESGRLSPFDYDFERKEFIIIKR